MCLAAQPMCPSHHVAYYPCFPFAAICRQDYCTAINQELRNNAEPEALTVQGMLGPFLVTMLFTIFGVIAHVSRMALFKTIQETRKVSRHGNIRDGLREAAWQKNRLRSSGPLWVVVELSLRLRTTFKR